MKNKIDDRELLALKGPDGMIPATYHRVRSDRDQANSSASDGGQIGILFLNSMSPTRAARGDSSVRWAEWFAESGYPAFRVDLPGYGDSDTDPPPALQDVVNLGGFTTAACAAIDQIVERFRLSGVVLFGLCSGAVIAVYTGAASRNCRGMILLDPYFHLPLVGKPNPLGKLVSFVPPGALRRVLRAMANKLIELRRRKLPKEMPANTNFQLLDQWKRAASRGLPALIINAPTARKNNEYFNYIDYIRKCDEGTGRVTVEVAQGADHTFSNSRGLAVVREHTERWLGAKFAFAGRNEFTADRESELVK